MISALLNLLPLLPLARCTYEDYKTRKCSNLSLLALALSYIPLALYNFTHGVFMESWYWLLFAAPQIAVWFILLVYGFITGRGGADRVVILLGALSPYGLGATLQALVTSAIIAVCKKGRNTKFPFIVPYFVFYVFFYLFVNLNL